MNKEMNKSMTPQKKSKLWAMISLIEDNLNHCKSYQIKQELRLKVLYAQLKE